MRRAAVLACAVLLCGATALEGQGPAAQQRDRTIENVVADAASVPPEFEADALLKLSESPKVDKAWRRELLDQAFIRAYGASEQYRRTSTQPIPPESRQGAQVFAYATALSRVTLQVRAVQLMAVVDPARAVELFEWIDLNLAPGACADPLVPAVDEYYSTLSRLAGAAFRRRSEGLNFFELYLWRAHLPSEMPAVARAIQRFRMGHDEAAYFEGLLRMLLQGSSPDPPGFASAAPDIIARMADLQIADTALDVLGSNVMDALRGYLLTQFKAPRCADNTTAASMPSTFNAAVRRARADFDVRPLDAEAARLPTTMSGVARIDLYWQSVDAGRLYDAMAHLRGPGAVARPLRVRQTAEWRDEAERLLTAIERWNGTSEPAERDFFYEKSVLFTWLLDLMPASQVRSRALRSFVDFLRQRETDVNRRALWFAFVNRLLEMSRGPYRVEVLTAMEDSHQPVLWLYARLERLTPERRP
jgi:hypothetical protein